MAVASFLLSVYISLGLVSAGNILLWLVVLATFCCYIMSLVRMQDDISIPGVQPLLERSQRFSMRRPFFFIFLPFFIYCAVSLLGGIVVFIGAQDDPRALFTSSTQAHWVYYLMAILTLACLYFFGKPKENADEIVIATDGWKAKFQTWAQQDILLYVLGILVLLLFVFGLWGLIARVFS